jgi:hypothetical protein
MKLKAKMKMKMKAKVPGHSVDAELHFKQSELGFNPVDKLKQVRA